MTLDELLAWARAVDAGQRAEYGQPAKVVVLIAGANGICAASSDDVSIDDMVKTFANVLREPPT